MRAFLFTALTLAAAIPAARAEDATRHSEINGDRLMRVCTSSNKTYQQGCEAYIDGVTDTIWEYQHSANESNGAFKIAGMICVPATPTAKLRDTVIGFMRAHPESRERPGGQIVYSALRGAYPCR